MITSCRDGQQIPNSGLVAFIHAVRLAAMQVVGLNGVSQQCRRCLGSKSSTATNRLVITSCCDGGWQISGEMELDCVGACYYSHAGLCECLLLLARHMVVYYPDTHAQVPKRVPTCNHLPLVALDAAALMRAERRGFFVLAPASLAGRCACSHASAVSSCVWVSSSSPACAPPRLVCAFLLSPSLLPRSPGSRSQGYSTRSAPHTVPVTSRR